MTQEFKKSRLEIINEVDTSKDPTSEAVICDRFRMECDQDVDDLESKAESMAYGFAENYKNDENYGWDTYYGPKFVKSNGDGSVSVSPHINFVTPEMIDYWEKRVGEVKNPVIKAKYADLVIDFSKKIKGKNADYRLVPIVIDSTLEIAKEGLHKDYFAIFTKLKRALSLACSYKIPEKITEVIDAIFEFEKVTEEELSPGTWGHAYDILIQRRDYLLPDQFQKLIYQLETRLQKSLNHPESYRENPYMVESPARRLAAYYHIEGDKENLKRVLNSIERAYTDLDKPTAMHQIFNLEKIQRLYKKYNFREEELRIHRAIVENRHKVLEDMKSVSSEIKINKKEFDDYIENITSGTLREIFKKIESHYTPRFDQVQKQLSDLCSKSPLSYLITQSIIDCNGRKVADLQPIEKDLDGHITNLARLNMSFGAWILSDTMDSLIKKHDLNTEKIVDELYKSPVFSEKRKKTITAGVKAYLEGNYTSAISILIPQIEAIFRELVKSMGELVEKPNDYGGADYVSLNTLLDKSVLKEDFGEDRVRYWKMLLTDPLGLNLRNDFSHGIPDDDDFDRLRADRLLHILIFFSLIRKREDPNNDNKQ